MNGFAKKRIKSYCHVCFPLLIYTDTYPAMDFFSFFFFLREFNMMKLWSMSNGGGNLSIIILMASAFGPFLYRKAH